MSNNDKRILSVPMAEEKTSELKNPSSVLKIAKIISLEEACKIADAALLESERKIAKLVEEQAAEDLSWLLGE
jgi:hypothetical protein